MKHGRNNFRRTFFKHLVSLAAFCGASVLSFKRSAGGRFGRLGVREASAMNNPDYAVCNSKNRIKIEYMGML